MNRDTFAAWLDQLGRVWETRDPQAVGALFSADALYQETPFDEPMRGRSAIVEYWSDVPKTQDHIRFSYEILAIGEETGVAHWWASFVRLPAEARVKLDGICAVALDAEGRCTSFREWWHRQEQAAG
jgi:hypothetical protein